MTKDQTKITEISQDVVEERNSTTLDQLRTFSEIGKALTSTVDLDGILNIVMEQISGLLKPKNWSLLLLDEETGELSFDIAVGKGSERIKDLKLKLGEGIAGWVAKEGMALLVPDVSKDPRFCDKADKVTQFKTESIICVPLRTKGKCLGVIELINKVHDTTSDIDSFGKHDLFLLTTLADYTAIAIENARLFEKIEKLTITDDLTRLYNSRHLHKYLDYEMDRSRRFNKDLSMIFIDLDYFKTINDEHGHLCGSKLLCEFSELIIKTLRSVDMAFRYGGDEFVMVLPETTKKDAVKVAHKLRDAFRKATFLTEEGVNCKMTASLGVATYPTDAKDKLQLIHKADTAMYYVKEHSRNDVKEA
ncbi:MAG: sensor domain-containing diguanylate cyclase [Deltaproteobacteria bacterium]|nr:sensor domain-containing diguanylate cyclase [Deltaproteobacteria bacterium]